MRSLSLSLVRFLLGNQLDYASISLDLNRRGKIPDASGVAAALIIKRQRRNLIIWRVLLPGIAFLAGVGGEVEMMEPEASHSS